VGRPRTPWIAPDPAQLCMACDDIAGFAVRRPKGREAQVFPSPADSEQMKDTVRGRDVWPMEPRLPIADLARPIFSAVSDAIILCRADTLDIVEANPAAILLYGYHLNELRSMRLPDLSAEPEQTRKQIARTLRSGKTTRDVRTHRRKDGALLTIEASGTIFSWQKQKLLLAVARDYSKHLKAENATRLHAEQMEDALMGTIESISTMTELRDPYTANHERRVGSLAERIALELGMTAAVAKSLRVIGLVHDIGKIATPAEILVRPGRLSAQEYALVQQHARQGFEILEKVEFPWPVARAVLQHHERMDGSGYPDGIKGDAIITEARIIAVADVVEAMASHRPYRPAQGIERALSEIEQSRGRLYDTAVADACLTLFREKGFVLAEAQDQPLRSIAAN